MAVPFFDLARQRTDLRQEMDAAVSRVMDSQRFILGPEVEAFEQELGSLVGVSNVVGVASGTDALLLALKALDFAPGDEVIVPSFTFFATAGAVWNAGLTPVFCDVEAGSFNVSVETLEASVTARTRAVIPVHLFGQMAPMDEILRWAAAQGFAVIEDAAQAIGARRVVPEGTMTAGATACMGAFSFFPTKNLGAYGDAGAVVTSDPALGERVAAARTHGGRRMYRHDFVGTNSRLDALQAAVLRTKLPHLCHWVEGRQRNAALYCELLADLEELELPRSDSGNFHTYNQFTIRTGRRDELQEFLTARRIGTAVYYPLPLHRQICFERLAYREGDFPVAERLCSEVLSLPVFPELRGEEIEEVSAAIQEFFRS